jgi:ATP-dependent Clp protease protease subunit
MSRYTQELQPEPIDVVLRKNRIINLVGGVNDEMAYYICSTLLVMNEEDSKKPIQMFINSPGGSITAGLAIIDTMNFISAPVYTYATGMAASMGAAILSAGEKGHRGILPNATVMIHQASSGAQGNIQDMVVDLEYTKALNEKMANMIGKNCGKTGKAYLKDTARDKFMFAEEALAYGIVDAIIQPEALKK